MLFDFFQHEWWLPLVIGGVMFLASATQRLLGFGFALVLISLLTPLLGRLSPLHNGIAMANLLATLSALVPILMVVYQFVAKAERTKLVLTFIGAIVGLPLGLLFFERASPVWLARGTGAVLLVMIVESLFQKSGTDHSRKRPPGRIWALVVGGVAGVLHGAVGVPGPPVVVYGSKQNWTPDQFRGYLGGALVLVTLTKAAMFATRGHIDSAVVSWSLFSIPFTLAGYQLGRYADARINPIWFRRFVLILVTLGTLNLLLYKPPAEESATPDSATQATTR